MRCRIRPCAEVHEVRRDQHAGLDRGAHAHHRDAEVAGTDLLEHLGLGRIGPHHVGELAGVLLDEVRIGVDREHLRAELLEGQGDRGAEAAQADHEDALVAGGAGHDGSFRSGAVGGRVGAGSV